MRNDQSKALDQLAALNKSMEAANALLANAQKAFELTTTLIDTAKLENKEGGANAADIQQAQADLQRLYNLAKSGKPVHKESVKLAKEIKNKFKK